ncbi:MAG TPA: TetR/AcrR family transcriptional regulator [Gaiellaceae bacterium]|jgi:AcrR family transcriptional regulator
MRRTREQRKQQTRGDLVTAARAAFLNSGFHRASLDEICEEAGYTTGAVYSNFSGKDGLFLAVFDERLDERMRASVEIALDAPDFEASARRTARDMIEAGRREPAWTPLVVEFWAHASRHDELRTAVRERHEKFLDATAGLLDEVARRYDVEYRISSREIARGLGALARGLGLERLLDGDVELDVFEDMFVGFVLGLAQPRTAAVEGANP